MARTQPIHALSVNGLLRCVDGLVLGRRQPAAIYMPGRWQAAPAGSVEARGEDRTVDVAEQLHAELREELGLERADVSGIVPVVAIAHPIGGIVDIGCLVDSALGFGEIEQRWRASGNAEYDALRLLPPDAVATLLASGNDELLPTARILLRCWSDRLASDD